MMTDNEIEKMIKQIIFNYLDSKEWKVFLFGSRAQGTNFKKSDWDIGIQSVKNSRPINSEVYADIVQELQDSDIPHIVEIVDFSQVSDEFKQIAKSHLKRLN